MSRKGSYLNVIRPILVGLFLLAGWLSLRLWQAEAREQALFQLSVSALSERPGAPVSLGSYGSSGQSVEFSEAILEQMDRLPGLRRRRALCCTEVEIDIDKYHTTAELCGIEMDRCPLTIVKSAGEKRTGTRPLLIAGNHFFESLSDEYGNRISGRQANILKEQIASLAVRLSVQDAADAAKRLAGGGVSTDEGGKNRFQDAELLGIAEEDGLYMDADQMKRWLAQLGLPCEIRRVELEIQGKRNEQKAEADLEKAGFSVVIRENCN